MFTDSGRLPIPVINKRSGADYRQEGGDPPPELCHPCFGSNTQPELLRSAICSEPAVAARFRS
jgi:hypothetical protein